MDISSERNIFCIAELVDYVASFLDPKSLMKLSLLDSLSRAVVCSRPIYIETITAYKQVVSQKPKLYLSKKTSKCSEIQAKLYGEIFLRGCQHGYLILVKDFYQKYRIHIEPYMNDGLALACLRNHADIAKYLTILGAKISEKNIKNYFMNACKYNLHSIMQYLLENGAKQYVNLVLESVYESGYTEIIKCFNENGINILIETKNKLIMACQKGHTDLVKYLVEFVDIRSYLYDLLETCSHKHPDLIDFLIVWFYLCLNIPT